LARVVICLGKRKIGGGTGEIGGKVLKWRLRSARNGIRGGVLKKPEGTKVMGRYSWLKEGERVLGNYQLCALLVLLGGQNHSPERVKDQPHCAASSGKKGKGRKLQEG